MKTLKSFLFVLVVAVLAGCGSVPKSSQLREISLGMTKNQVVSALGEPSAVRGAILNKFDQNIEVWEYVLAMPSTDSAGQVAGKTMMTILTLGVAAQEFKSETKNYWLYFQNNKLAQWGVAGDWAKESSRVYDFNFNPGPKLTN